MTNIVTFSGWGQKYDSLENIAPGANHIDYKKFQDIRELFSSLEETDCDILIGWSLGGQLALRSIEEGIFSPELLVLLATPFQFLIGKGLRCGVNVDSFNAFEKGFKDEPKKTLKHLSTIIGKNDIHSKDIIRKLNDDIDEDILPWRYWLEELGQFSCQKLNFSSMPKTIVIHGLDDTVVDITQTGLFRPLIRNLRIEIFDHCGHAPHLHDPQRVQDLINDA